MRYSLVISSALDRMNSSNDQPKTRLQDLLPPELLHDTDRSMLPFWFSAKCTGIVIRASRILSQQFQPYLLPPMRFCYCNAEQAIYPIASAHLTPYLVCAASQWFDISHRVIGLCSPSFETCSVSWKTLLHNENRLRSVNYFFDLCFGWINSRSQTYEKTLPLWFDVRLDRGDYYSGWSFDSI